MGKIKTSMRSLTHTGRLSMFRRVIARMTKNPYFPEPWKTLQLSIAILIALAERYEASIIAASRGDRDNIQTRNEISDEVQAAIEKLANYVELEAGDNMAALRSTGMELRRQRSKTAATAQTATLTLNVENLPQEGKIYAEATPSPRAISCEMQFNTGNPLVEGEWLHKAVLPPFNKTEVDGFTSGLNHIRIREITADGAGPWSNSVSTFVT